MTLAKQFETYKTNPRVLELRLAVTYEMMFDKYGEAKANNLIKNLCGMFGIDAKIIEAVTSSRYSIQRMEKKNTKRYRQEMVFMGMVYGETRNYVAKHYLNLNRTTVYKKELDLKVEEFATNEWLAKLEENVVVCNIQVYREELIKFNEGLDTFLELMGNGEAK